MRQRRWSKEHCRRKISLLQTTSVKDEMRQLWEELKVFSIRSGEGISVNWSYTVGNTHVSVIRVWQGSSRIVHINQLQEPWKVRASQSFHSKMLLCAKYLQLVMNCVKSITWRRFFSWKYGKKNCCNYSWRQARSEEAFKFAIVTKKTKQLSRDYIFECNIDGSTNKITIAKGLWCITVRFVEIAHPTNLEYIIPTKQKK